ncbi:hypothetical protein SCMU_18230 [Sinomonas cyclohexanicum]|uniref:Helix-turn-helix domain-containing protein n=1 Tax=Sinomonas cyclohexanicum TaxID=322009 RepID=A0ABN6FGR6_SINCY|nr:helix-turn-helix domain-containing protein [Corynebacterium cyclohexanicum]BCT75981.1 hypothetical protein SCMU_18230 [Corynebacterium cyclohexanicum]
MAIKQIEPLELYSAEDVMRLYGVSRRFVQARIDDGQLTPLWLGRYLRFAPEEVHALLRTSRTPEEEAIARANPRGRAAGK